MWSKVLHSEATAHASLTLVSRFQVPGNPETSGNRWKSGNYLENLLVKRVSRRWGGSDDIALIWIK